MIKCLFATHNQHKVEEVAAIMSGLDLELISLRDIGYTEEILENGVTLEENAWIKANFIQSRCGGNVIAEDTGLEVDALLGEPGVYSARYAGPHKSNEDNVTKLLYRLNDIENRAAQFRTVLAVKINNTSHTFEGIIRGSILTNPSGKGGFGYDPVFVPEGYQKSFGLLSRELKNQISHRAKAFELFRAFLTTLK